MDVFNLFAEPEGDGENDRDGYRHRVVAVGQRLGASLLGGSLYELPPGEKTWPYHYETGCEEWLLVVSGRPTLRGPDGERVYLTDEELTAARTKAESDVAAWCD